MSETTQSWWGRFLGLAVLMLLLQSGRAAGQLCCECLNCPDGVSACSSTLGLDRRTYSSLVCEPLGCVTATCVERECDRGGSNRCPASEVGQCADGVDNDADGLVDAEEGECAGEIEPGADCCVARDTPGCSDEVCEACVCDQDPFCCTDFWDPACAAESQELCSAECFCGPGGGTPVPTAVAEECQIAFDCGQGEVCQGGQCVAGTSWCLVDVDCLPSEECLDGTCGPRRTPTPTPTPIACFPGRDCPAGYRCENRECVVAPPTPTPTGGGGGGGGGGCSIIPARGAEGAPGWWIWLLPGLVFGAWCRRARPCNQ